MTVKRAQRRTAGVEQRRQQDAGDEDRDGGENDPAGEAEVPVVKIAPPHRLDRADDEAAHIAPEIADDRGQRRQLHRRREGRARIAPAEQRRNDAHMRRRGDRQKLGNALNDAKNADLGVAKRDEAGIEPCGAGRRHRCCPLGFARADAGCIRPSFSSFRPEDQRRAFARPGNAQSTPASTRRAHFRRALALRWPARAVCGKTRKEDTAKNGGRPTCDSSARRLECPERLG